MKNLVIENKRNQIILKLNKKDFDEEYLISLVKQLQLESLARKSEFSTDVLQLAEEINEEWWNKNKGEFLQSSQE